MAKIGQEFHLPDITTEEWLPALRARFLEADARVVDREILWVIEQTDGHPRRTMLACSYVLRAAESAPDRSASHEAVVLALTDARRDRGWS